MKFVPHIGPGLLHTSVVFRRVDPLQKDARPSGYAIVGGEPQLARSYDGELNTITGEPIVHSMV
eukprot:COSAG05_NODE_3800_length_1831_cov_32.714203_4_plen_63_part_01